jgi:hypothetical protein
MYVNPKEMIEPFKVSRREKVVDIFDGLKLDNVWTKYFWVYYYQLVKLLAHPKLFAKIHAFVNVV